MSYIGILVAKTPQAPTPQDKLLELLLRNVAQAQDLRPTAHEAAVAFQIVLPESQARPELVVLC